MTIQAIPTWYAGCYFRSRLEARWAVFFDSMDIEWRYEPQGFETPHGRYLPDFWLPESQTWIEVKGGDLTQRDYARAVHVAADSWSEKVGGFRVLRGDIPRAPLMAGMGVSGSLLGVRCLSWTGPIPLEVLLDCPLPPEAAKHVVIIDAFNRDGSAHSAGEPVYGFVPSVWVPVNIGQLPTALNAARSARFEHGESGAQVRAT